MNTRRKRILTYTLIIISIDFLALTVLVKLFPTWGFDVKFSKEVQEHQNPFLNEVMLLISTPGYWPWSAVVVAATSLLYLAFRYKKAALYVAITALSGLVSSAVKAIINRPRPSADIVDVLFKTTETSFPSGHTLFYVVFFGFQVVLMNQLEDIPKWLRVTITVLSLFLVFSIPLSRIYLGAHWFTDVTAGFLLGLLCLYLLSWLYLRKPAKKDEAPEAEVK